MKRFLHAGERYAHPPTLDPTSIHIKHPHTQTHSINLGAMRYASSFAKVTRAFGQVALFCLIASCGAFQKVETYGSDRMPKIGKYKIGDKLPKEFVIGYDPFDSTRTYSLNEFKGKAVILDLWATWCGSCIEGFPLMDSLQLNYKDKLQIILVNILGIDNPDKVRLFLEGHQLSNVKVLIQSEPMHNLFTFRSIPHYIWIDKNRRIRAFSKSEDITSENLTQLFAGLPINILMKRK